jgi:signal transduction histidine kinase/ActR/RegA family two-component response regulator
MPHRADDRIDERVLLWAPLGRDSDVLSQILSSAGFAPYVCSDGDELASKIEDGAGAVIVTGEALGRSTAAHLVAKLKAQPAWSDLPILVLAGGEAHEPRMKAAIDALRAAGNLVLVERPVRKLNLLTALDVALRARRRQYEAWDLIRAEHAARQEAEASSRIKDEFLATVSHELRTPMNAILIWANLLTERGHDRALVHQGLSAIARSAAAQAKLIEDLLDVSRAISGKLQIDVRDVDIESVARAAVDVIRPAAEAKGVVLQVSCPSGIVVRVDPDRMQQVLWNLLSNAVKFTPDRGRVSLKVMRDRRLLRVEVSDTGRGISSEFLPHVFERFRQAEIGAKRLQGGLGLGLAISRQLVELHGGVIEVDSQGEGLGTVFTVELPIALERSMSQAEMTRPDVSGANLVSRSLEGVRALLVEDDANSREAMACVLERHGARVRSVDSGAAAMAALSAEHANDAPSIVLSDLGLPKMDGCELLARIQSLYKARGERAPPAAAVTAYVSSAERTRALAAGFSMYVAKPVAPERLVAVAKDLAARAREPHHSR